MRKPSPFTRKNGQTVYRVRYRAGGRGSTETTQTFDTEPEAKDFCHWLDTYGVKEAEDRLFAKLTAEQPDQGATMIPFLDAVAFEQITTNTGTDAAGRRRNESIWRRVWSPRFGRLPANELTRQQVREAYNELVEQVGYKTVKNYRGVLSSVCGHAVELGYLRTMPTARVKIPDHHQHEQREGLALTDDQVAALLAAWEEYKPHYTAFTRFLVETGLRFGEAVELRVGDVDVDGRLPVIRVRRALKDSGEVGAPKTKRGKRPVPVYDETVLADLRERTRGRPHDALVYTAPRGGRVQHSNYSLLWDVVVVIAGFGDWPVLPVRHDLRHTFGSRLLEDGVPPVTVSRLMGHESIQTTADIYGQIGDAALHQAMAQRSDRRLRLVPPMTG